MKGVVLCISGQHDKRYSIKYAAVSMKELNEVIKSHGGRIPLLKKILYLRWKYPTLPNFFKKHFPFLVSSIKNIIKKI